MKVLSVLLIVIILCSCSGKNKKPQPEKTVDHPEVQTQKTLTFQKVGELFFRRSYAEGQFREMSDAEYEKINKSNPSGDGGNDTSLLKRIHEFGFVNNNNELLLKKFNSYKPVIHNNPETSFVLTDEKGDKLNCSLISAFKESKYKLKISSNDQTKEFTLDGFCCVEGMSFIMLDIIPGGYKELVVHHEYYIMLGDNDDIIVYEVTFK